MDKDTKLQTITKIQELFKLDAKNVGATEVQIGILTARINELTEHLKLNKKDNSSRRGLMALVNNRRRLLNYLIKENYEHYTALVAELKIRR